jgi:hypothetical protein
MEIANISVAIRDVPGPICDSSLLSISIDAVSTYIVLFTLSATKA